MGNHAASTSLTHLHPTNMPSREENADLFQKMVVFKYVEDNGRKQSKDILVKRDAVAQYDVRRGVVITSTRPRSC